MNLGKMNLAEISDLNLRNLLTKHRSLLQSHLLNYQVRQSYPKILGSHIQIPLTPTLTLTQTRNC